MSRQKMSGSAAVGGTGLISGYISGPVPGALLRSDDAKSQSDVGLGGAKKPCCDGCKDGKDCKGSKIMGMSPLLFIALAGAIVYMASRK